MSNKENDEILESQFENCGKCTELEFANSHEVGCDCSCHALPEEEGLRDATDLDGMYDDGSEESKKVEKQIIDQEHNNFYK